MESYRSDLHQFEEFLLESGTTLVGVNKTNIKDLCTQK
nr:hypothetical protein [Wolbachia endosymbiont of Glossina morsitans morsitans]